MDLKDSEMDSVSGGVGERLVIVKRHPRLPISAPIYYWMALGHGICPDSDIVLDPKEPYCRSPIEEIRVGEVWRVNDALLLLAMGDGKEQGSIVLRRALELIDARRRLYLSYGKLREVSDLLSEFSVNLISVVNNAARASSIVEKCVIQLKSDLDSSNLPEQ